MQPAGRRLAGVDQEDRIALFLDYENLALGARDHLGGMTFDVRPIADALAERGRVVVRKAYGAGLYAMAGPGFEPDATIALPTAKIAVMGAEAAVNAVYANKIAALPSDQERAAFVAQKRAEYEADIDIMRLASELVVDAVVVPHELRGELVRRFALAGTKDRHFSRRRHGVTPV